MIPPAAVDTGRLRDRLAAIAQVLAGDPDALALLGLGSCGVETGRLDGWSDLDVFVIVAPGCEHRFTQDVWWLARAAPDGAPLMHAFRNTADGWKALYADGVFVECAVFAQATLAHIPYHGGRIIWQRGAVLDEAAAAGRRPGPAGRDWLVGEALTNLFVGLGRFWRGEQLAAHRLVQVAALDRLLELEGGGRDPFNAARGRRHDGPGAAWLETASGPPSTVPQAAAVILDRLEALTDALPAPLVAAVRARLSGQAGPG